MNVDLLKLKIKKSGYKCKFIAEKLRLSYPGFQKKLNGVTEFSAAEIGVMKNLLKIDNLELNSIFWPD